MNDLIDIYSLPDGVLLTCEDAAKALRTTVNNLSIVRSKGVPNIPYVKIGRSVRYRAADLKEFVNANLRGK